jgi:hypothetical protein|tara:strand:+ start:384 stop:713 length:330 start_codon:yes stop_codon:yes gene_type:complete
LEAFLLSIRDEYDRLGGDTVALKYMAKHQDLVSRDAIKKTKMRLLKYGLWNKGESRLDDVEKEICTYTIKQVDEIGTNELATRLGEKHKLKMQNCKQKIAAMKKYGFIR